MLSFRYSNGEMSNAIKIHEIVVNKCTYNSESILRFHEPTWGWFPLEITLNLRTCCKDGEASNSCYVRREDNVNILN